MTAVQVCKSLSCQAGGYTYSPEHGTWVCATCGYPSERATRKSRVASTNTHEKESIVATTDSFNKFLTELRDLIDAHLSGTADAVVAEPKKSSAKASAKVDKEEVVTEAGDREAELMKTNIRTLRKMAIELGFDEDEVSEAEKSDLVESILAEEEEAGDTEAEDVTADAEEDAEEEAEEEAEEADDEADEDEDEDEDEEEEDEEDEEDEGEYTREDLEGLTLTALKKIAKEEFEETTASLKGLDTDDLIALILGEDVDDEEEEDDEEGLTEEDLEAMSLAEVKAVAKENGIKVKAGMKKDEIIEALFA